MSQTVSTIGTAPAPVAKTRKKRAMPESRPAFIIMQVLDESGKPVAFDKKRLKVLSVERSAEKVVDLIDEPANHAFHMRVMVPAGTRAGSPNKPKDAA